MTVKELLLAFPLALACVCHICVPIVEIMLMKVHGVHALSCLKSQGRLPCHSSLNDIDHQVSSCGSGCALYIHLNQVVSASQMGDGRTFPLYPLHGHMADAWYAWDATCHNTYAHSNIQLACSGPDLVADKAASANRQLYEDISITHDFAPIAMESAGSFRKNVLSFFSQACKTY